MKNMTLLAFTFALFVPMSIFADSGEIIIKKPEIQEISEERSSTVMIGTFFTKSKKFSACTGTLIGEHHILTSAHCAVTSGDENFKRIGFGLDIKDSFGPNHTHPFFRTTDIKIYPEFKLNSKLYSNSDNDMAIISFDGNIPEGFKIREISTNYREISENEQLITIGYGKTNENTNDEGVLRKSKIPSNYLRKNVSVKYFENGIFLKDVNLEFNNSILIMMPEIEKKSLICNGDSGGPLFVSRNDNTLELIAISSRKISLIQDKDKSDLACNGVAVFTDIRSKIDWINGTIKSMKN